jgi:hypothetical protein
MKECFGKSNIGQKLMIKVERQGFIVELIVICKDLDHVQSLLKRKGITVWSVVRKEVRADILGRCCFLSFKLWVYGLAGCSI